MDGLGNQISPSNDSNYLEFLMRALSNNHSYFLIRALREIGGFKFFSFTRRSLIPELFSDLPAGLSIHDIMNAIRRKIATR